MQKARDFYHYALIFGQASVAGIIAAILFMIAPYYFGAESFFAILHYVCLWVFYIGLPISLVCAAISAVYYFLEKGDKNGK